MGKRNSVEQRVFELLTPLVEEQGCELVDIEYVPVNKSKVLRLIIDKTEGVGLDDCSSVSLAVEPILDAADVIPTAYDLEVSSPGVDRPIVTDRDFVRNKGRLVEVFLEAPINKRERYEGTLDSTNEDAISITLDEPFIKGIRPKTNGTVMTISRDNIRLIRRTIRF